jgi:hypothetical protein
VSEKDARLKRLKIDINGKELLERPKITMINLSTAVTKHFTDADGLTKTAMENQKLADADKPSGSGGSGGGSGDGGNQTRTKISRFRVFQTTSEKPWGSSVSFTLRSGSGAYISKNSDWSLMTVTGSQGIAMQFSEPTQGTIYWGTT